MLAGNRDQRIGEEILREMSDLLLRKVKDPRLKGVGSEVKRSHFN